MLHRAKFENIFAPLLGDPTDSGAVCHGRLYEKQLKFTLLLIFLQYLSELSLGRHVTLTRNRCSKITHFVRIQAKEISYCRLPVDTLIVNEHMSDEQLSLRGRETRLVS